MCRSDHIGIKMVNRPKVTRPVSSHGNAILQTTRNHQTPDEPGIVTVRRMPLDIGEEYAS